MSTTLYPVPCLAGKPLQRNPIHISVPGSKSITNRALLLAMLAEGESCLSGALFSDDSRHFLSCLSSLGFETEADENASRIRVKGCGGRIPLSEASLYVGSAGTAARFLSACLGISEGCFHMDASPQMRRRPMAPLLASLKELGCEISYEGQEGFFPFTLTGHGFLKHDITIDIDASSQFLSALLIASALSAQDMTITAAGHHGMAYIDMTRKMMAQFGVQVLSTPENGFFIPAGQHYRGRSYAVEPDVSAACYFYAMAAVLGLSVVVEGVMPGSLQGDLEFLSILERMGCLIEEHADGLCLTGPGAGKLSGLTADLSACSDQAITLAAIAPFAASPVTITGIGHIRHQESDRISAIAENLSGMGIRCEEKSDSIVIYPGLPHPAHIKTHDDHRLAMGFSLTGLAAPGICIENPECCKKTFETYFTVLEQAIQKASLPD